MHYIQVAEDYIRGSDHSQGFVVFGFDTSLI